MHPASPAALLSYLVLRLIECDTLRRQKSQLIQSNKLPMQNEGSHTSSPHPATRSVNLCLSGLFFFNSFRRWADLKSWGPEYSAFPSTVYRWFESHFLECGHKRHKIVHCFYVFSIRGLCKSGLLIHPSKQSHLGWLNSKCATCVYQIPEHFCMRTVVILKPKTYNISATAIFELLNYRIRLVYRD